MQMPDFEHRYIVDNMGRMRIEYGLATTVFWIFVIMDYVDFVV